MAAKKVYQVVKPQQPPVGTILRDSEGDLWKRIKDDVWMMRPGDLGWENGGSTTWMDLLIEYGPLEDVEDYRQERLNELVAIFDNAPNTSTWTEEGIRKRLAAVLDHLKVEL